MPRQHFAHVSPIALAVSCLLTQAPLVGHAQAQSNTSLPDVTISAPKSRESRATITGFGDAPAWQAPMQAERYSSEALKEAQVQRLADLTKLDASVSDSYNAGGYWDYLSVRGFTLDNKQNYLREGLPISAETSLPLDNKRAVEVLKGTSGIQAGISAPGGLVNLLVKRPEGRVYTAEVALTGARSVLTAVDLSDRFGVDNAFGLRLNAAHEHLNPAVHNDVGNRQLVSLAADWRVAPGTLIEVEAEHSRRSQASVPAYSLLGNTLPSAQDLDPNTNFNARPWSKPVVMRGNTGTVRLQQDLPAQWKLVGTYGEQRLRSDDRAAFPFGCSNGPVYLADRYCADGSFDLYDYQSDGETRVTKALDVNVAGKWRMAATLHDTTVGFARSLKSLLGPTAIYDYVQSGTVYDTYGEDVRTPYLSPQNNTQEQQTALYVRDAITLAPQWRAWLGLRSTQIQRQQWLSDDSVPVTRESRTLNTPWAALGYEWAPRKQAYVSWGEGIEINVTPFSFNYTSPGRYLPPSKSRQVELGLKAQEDALFWSVNLFQAIRPMASGVDDGTGLLDYRIDGDARHRGLEGQAQWRVGRWSLAGSALWMDAQRRHSSNDTINGKAPVNVPDHTLKVSAAYNVAALPGLRLVTDLVREGPRTADATNDIRLSAWNRIDLGLSLTQTMDARTLTWRLGVSNLLDTRAWRESPTQFGHIYLFPMPSRTVTASAQMGF